MQHHFSNRFRRILLSSLAALIPFALCPAAVGDEAARSEDPLYDIVVYGDSSGAVIAAVDAKRRGHSVILVNPTHFPGGMSASGLGATDFLGRRDTFGGLASEFYDRVAEAYGTNFVRSFEPHVGHQVFKNMLAESGVAVVYNERLDRSPGKGVTMAGRRIAAITTLSGKTYRGRMFIDATYVGDLMAIAGVSYTVGREPESQYGEDMAGVRRGDTKPRKHYSQHDKDHFIKEVDPHVRPGDPASGLLPYVFRIDGLTNGQGDRKIQAYNYRVCLTTDPQLRIPITKPDGYREIDHELLLRNFDAGDTRLPALIEPLAGTGSKVDWNHMHAVGSDHPGANWDYPEASYERRSEIEKQHETYIRGFLWTLSNNPRVPEAIRSKAATYGLPKDEFTDNVGWPWMIYIREARRMVSDYVMTQHECEGRRSAPDPVALGSFGMDSHAVQHFVTEQGHVQNEGVIWRVPPKPYGISYRSIIPRKGECENLFSPICMGASHVAHGSIRMEPVFMALSQSAAIAAGLALEKNVSVQNVAYPELRARLDAAKQIVALKSSIDSRGARNSPSAADPTNTPAASLLGSRFLTLNTIVRVRQIEVSRKTAHGPDESSVHTPAEARTFREAIENAWPGARITWAFSWLALHDGRDSYRELRELVVSYHQRFGDEITFIPGAYFANMYNTREQVNRDLHEGLKRVSEIVGNGYRPKSVVAGFLAADNLRYLAERENIHVCQGNIWSQYAVDNGDGEGSVCYPYYPSREHFCKPARGKDDFIDIVNLDGWTVDFLAARIPGGRTVNGERWRSRQGVGPIETLLDMGTERGLEAMMATTASHFDDGFQRNGFAWVTCGWEMSLVEARKIYGYGGRNGMDGLHQWLTGIRQRWPDAQLITQGEFGELWRAHFNDNDRINYQFVHRGCGIRASEANQEIRWFMNRDFRLALLRDWKNNGPEMVIDFTRYDLPAKEPADPEPGKHSRNWSLINRINQKGTRAQDQPVALEALADEEKALIRRHYPELFGNRE